MDKQFQIGTFCFRVVSQANIDIPQNFLLFETFLHSEPEYTYFIRIVERFSIPDTPPIVKRPGLTVYNTPTGEMRILGVADSNQKSIYACCREIDENTSEILLNPHELEGVSFDAAFTSLFSLEKKMSQKASLILHCSYVDNNGRALLFSAPSGTGKSTQASLWEKYCKVKTINGDRALISRTSMGWHCYGWPVCGSSGICHNEDRPIATIVILGQASKNQIRQLHPSEAFARLYGEITINRWNQEHSIHCIELLEYLVKEIPIYYLECTISKEAVECLYETLER